MTTSHMAPGRHAALRPTVAAGGRWPRYVAPVGASAPRLATTRPPRRGGPDREPRRAPSAAAHPIRYAVLGLSAGMVMVGAMVTAIWAVFFV